MIKTYYEVTIEGSFDLVKGFVIGFIEGSRIEGEAIFGREHHVDNETKFGQLLRLLGVKGDTVHLIMGAGFHDVLDGALKKHEADLGVSIVKVREIEAAYFDFSYKAYSKEIGETMKKMFGALSRDPRGLHLEGTYEPVEKIQPEGKGIEAYAPLHEYELKAKGRIRGPIRDVIDFYGMVEHYDMVELEPIKLEFE